MEAGVREKAAGETPCAAPTPQTREQLRRCSNRRLASRELTKPGENTIPSLNQRTCASSRLGEVVDPEHGQDAEVRSKLLSAGSGCLRRRADSPHRTLHRRLSVVTTSSTISAAISRGRPKESSDERTLRIRLRTPSSA